jgi:spoIIIJ-associated protein
MEAKTVDEAVRLALVELGVPAEKAMVDILDEGKGGILGFGARNAVVEVSYEESTSDLIESFLRPILDKMGIAPSMEITQTDEQISVKMQGENSGIAIGRRGETLDALQYLTSLVINRTSDDYTRVSWMFPTTGSSARKPWSAWRSAWVKRFRKRAVRSRSSP